MIFSIKTPKHCCLYNTINIDSRYNDMLGTSLKLLQFQYVPTMCFNLHLEGS